MEELIAQIGTWIGAVTVLLTAVIGICQLIPGEQPEKTLQKIVDIVTKFSTKK